MKENPEGETDSGTTLCNVTKPKVKHRKESNQESVRKRKDKFQRVNVITSKRSNKMNSYKDISNQQFMYDDCSIQMTEIAREKCKKRIDRN